MATTAMKTTNTFTPAVLTALLITTLSLSGMAQAGPKGKPQSAVVAEDKITILHKPGTPAEHEITISVSALPAHIRHGDILMPGEEESCAVPGQVAELEEGVYMHLDTECSLNQVLDLFTTLSSTVNTAVACQPDLANYEALIAGSWFGEGLEIARASALVNEDGSLVDGHTFDSDGLYDVQVRYTCPPDD